MHTATHCYAHHSTHTPPFAGTTPRIHYHTHTHTARTHLPHAFTRLPTARTHFATTHCPHHTHALHTPYTPHTHTTQLPAPTPPPPPPATHTALPAFLPALPHTHTLSLVAYGAIFFPVKAYRNQVLSPDGSVAFLLAGMAYVLRLEHMFCRLRFWRGST